MPNEVWLTGLMESHRFFAIPLSLLIETVIAVAGVLPSFFITAANIAVFGLGWGIALSVTGESLGAVVAFLLYRKGLSRLSSGGGSLSSRVEKLTARLAEAPEGRSFLLVLALRLLPYVPSGAVTFAAAGGRMKLWNFVIASTLGKIPALVLEAASVTLLFRLPLKTVMAVTGGLILAWLGSTFLRKRKKSL